MNMIEQITGVENFWFHFDGQLLPNSIATSVTKSVWLKCNSDCTLTSEKKLLPCHCKVNRYHLATRCIWLENRWPHSGVTFTYVSQYENIKMTLLSHRCDSVHLGRLCHHGSVTTFRCVFSIVVSSRSVFYLCEVKQLQNLF